MDEIVKIKKHAKIGYSKVTRGNSIALNFKTKNRKIKKIGDHPEDIKQKPLVIAFLPITR